MGNHHLGTAITTVQIQHLATIKVAKALKSRQQFLKLA